jgi:hypothetical protein
VQVLTLLIAVGLGVICADATDGGDDPDYGSMLAARLVSERQFARQLTREEMQRFAVHNISGHRLTPDVDGCNYFSHLPHFAPYDTSTTCYAISSTSAPPSTGVPSHCLNLSPPSLSDSGAFQCCLDCTQYSGRGVGLMHAKLRFDNSMKSEFGGLQDTYASTWDSVTQQADISGYHSIPLANRSVNNLGGLGPNNYSYCFTLSTLSVPWFPSPASCGSYADHTSQFVRGNYGAQPNFIRLNDITVYNGSRIALRIDNTTEFMPAKPAMNDFNGLNFQLNLKPIYDVLATNASAWQPFLTSSGYAPGTYPGLDAIDNFLIHQVGTDLRAQNGNAASLFFSFFDQDTGMPVELEEVRWRTRPMTPLPTGRQHSHPRRVVPVC